MFTRVHHGGITSMYLDTYSQGDWIRVQSKVKPNEWTMVDKPDWVCPSCPSIYIVEFLFSRCENYLLLTSVQVWVTLASMVACSLLSIVVGSQTQSLDSTAVCVSLHGHGSRGPREPKQLSTMLRVHDPKNRFPSSGDISTAPDLSDCGYTGALI
jgi:hypothetical protein